MAELESEDMGLGVGSVTGELTSDGWTSSCLMSDGGWNTFVNSFSRKSSLRFFADVGLILMRSFSTVLIRLKI